MPLQMKFSFLERWLAAVKRVFTQKATPTVAFRERITENPETRAAMPGSNDPTVKILSETESTVSIPAEDPDKRLFKPGDVVKDVYVFESTLAGGMGIVYICQALSEKECPHAYQWNRSPVVAPTQAQFANTGRKMAI
jgi:hypothetical protein